MARTFGRRRRNLYGLFAGAAGAAVAAAVLSGPGGPAATAASDPCAASEIARTVGSVATSTGNYLDAHPQTNAALTTLAQQQAGPQTLAALKSYFDANPQTAKDMQQLQQPLVGLSTRCKLPITIPQVLGLMQAVQQSGGLPGAAVPAQPSPAAPLAHVPGALPGPAAASAG